MALTGLLLAMDKFAYISIVLAFMAGVGLSSMYFSDLQPKVEINRTESDIYSSVSVSYVESNIVELFKLRPFSRSKYILPPSHAQLQQLDIRDGRKSIEAFEQASNRVLLLDSPQL